LFDVSSVGTYAIVGLAACLAATNPPHRSPRTSSPASSPATSPSQMPVLVACAIAAGVARLLYIDSVYTAELTRRGLRWRLTLDGRRVIDSPQHVHDAALVISITYVLWKPSRCIVRR